MFGIGTPEILIIIVAALLIFGPSKIPELGKTLGKGLREFKKATSDIKDQINPLSENDDHNHDNVSETKLSALHPAIENKPKRKPAVKKQAGRKSSSTAKAVSDSAKTSKSKPIRKTTKPKTTAVKTKKRLD